MDEMFTSISGYDRFMGRWSAQLAPRFLDFARIFERGRFLDAGCGTGSRPTSGSCRSRPVAGVA